MNVDIDGTDITRYCLTRRWHPKLSRPAAFTIRYPSRKVSVNPGISELHMEQGGTLLFSGYVTQPQLSGEADTDYTELTAYDHLIHTKDRMVKSGSVPPGNMITPFAIATTGPGIFAEYINNTRTIDPGPYPLAVGSVAGGGIDLWESFSQFPMSLEQLRDHLVSTGQMDIFLSPGSGESTLNLTNGDGGDDLSGSVSYQFKTGANNARVATLTVDTDQIRNAIWYLLAPRISETRWKGSITPTAPNKGGTWPASLLARIALSRALYHYRQEIQTKEQAGSFFYRPMYEAQWASESWLRALPRTLATVLPKRGTFPSFKPGDKISVASGVGIDGGGFSGAQRVYEFVVEQDPDDAIAVTDILCSADQEGAP